MSAYQSLAGAYDALTTDVQYLRRADYLDRLLKKDRQPVFTVLDLGCGTGTIACLLSQRGYQVTAVDSSEEMLIQAARKAEALPEENRPLLLLQSMDRLRLLEKVDAVVSTMDALNYLTRPAAVQRTFDRVFRWLRPGGMLIFDVNTPYKLRRMDGELYIDEKPDTYCVWRTAFSEKTRICTYWVDLFRLRPDGTWERTQEEHRERAWEEPELRDMLARAGFDQVWVTGDLSRSAPKPGEDRVIFHCRKAK